MDTMATPTLNQMKEMLSAAARKLLFNTLRLQRVARVCVHNAGEFTNFTIDEPPPKMMKLLPPAIAGGEALVTLLTGQTIIGQQAAAYIKMLMETAKVPVAFERFRLTPDSDPREYLLSVFRNRVAIHVALQHDPVQKHLSMLLNNKLDLFATVVKLKSFEGFNCRFPNAKCTIVMQNNIGDYTKLEYEPVKGIVETLRFIDGEATRKYLNYVFEYAAEHGFKKITLGNKRSEMPKSDGLFIEIAHEIRDESFPDIEIEDLDIDHMVRYIIMQPERFSFICCNDRYGTVVTSIFSAVCGGAGLFSAHEVGENHSVFKPLQTKLSISDNRELSPYGIVDSCINMLHHLKKHRCANVLEKELCKTMLEHKVKTKEFGGDNAGDFIICHIMNRLKCRFPDVEDK